MTVATLLLTCLIFLALGKTTKADTLTALTIAGVVCIAASNGGTTSQDLKTGFLVGSTPKAQQIAILVGALAFVLERPSARPGRQAVVAGALYLAALLTKESGVVAPLRVPIIP